MDNTACNYNADANRNDDSCLYQSELFDCEGVCIAETSSGCDCGQILDICGECDGSGPNQFFDCDGNCGSELDCNGECGGTATLDCNGDCGGLALVDCNGECGGSAAIDCNGDCGGTAIEDCNGICNGNFVVDENDNCCDPNSVGSCGLCSDYGLQDSDFYDDYEQYF